MGCNENFRSHLLPRGLLFADMHDDLRLFQTRRQFFGQSAAGLGLAALGSLLNPQLFSAAVAAPSNAGNGSIKTLHFAPKAKRVIYLHQSGGPAHIDLVDYKPAMQGLQGKELPASIRNGQRVTGMTSGQSSFPVAASQWKWNQHGKAGLWLSELLPHTGKIADEICVLKSLHTEAINHDPAITFIQTGSQQPGRPCIGSWLSYGLGSASENLPAFIVLISQGSGNKTDQPLFSRLWGSGFLPSSFQGVKFRNQGDPVLYISNPAGVDAAARREQLDTLRELNQLRVNEVGDPEIETRIGAYEMAYKMQSSVPELMDLKGEPPATFEMYGEDARKPGTYAANCLLARRLVERGVRFVQLYHRGWDQHGSLKSHLPKQCQDVDQASSALVQDLKQRGMLDDTLVVWGGEFGRTAYVQGSISNPGFGRDHHGRCFSVWMAGGGIKPGITYGETDDYCYNVTAQPVHVHDFNATVLRCLGIDHERLTYRFQGRDFRLTDIHGHVVPGLMT
jgi:hypothetical protein